MLILLTGFMELGNSFAYNVCKESGSCFFEVFILQSMYLVLKKVKTSGSDGKICSTGKDREAEKTQLITDVNYTNTIKGYDGEHSFVRSEMNSQDIPQNSPGANDSGMPF